MATDPALRATLLENLGGISKQRLSQVVAEVNKAYGPMSTEDATYVLAHQRGIRIDRYLDAPTVDRVRGMLQRTAAHAPAPAVPPARAPSGSKRTASRPVRIEPTSPAIDPLLPPSVAEDADRMAKVYSRLYILENSARNVISRVMTAKHGKGWWSSKVPSDVQKEVRRRQDKEDKNPWAGKRGAQELNYADYGHLEKIITHNWDDFRDIFPDQAFVGRTLGGLEPTRNVTAHNNRVADKEEDRLRIHLDDWVKQIEGRSAFIP
jgi:hypothetical protein